MVLAGEVGRWSPAPRWRERLWSPIVWGDVHRRLASQPLFARCTRAEIRRIARAGDLCAVRAGAVLCGEDRIGYWLYVVMSGSIGLARRGRSRETVTAGGHVGEVAILGFGPQPMTATALTDSVVFVLGRRDVLDLVAQLPSLQQALFPDLPPDGYPSRIRELREAGTAAWKTVSVARRALVTSSALPASIQRFPPRRREDGPDLFRSLLAGVRGPPIADVVAVALRPLSRRTLGLVSAGVVAVAIAIGATFHPGVLVVNPNDPIDVSRDITVEGIPVRPPSGRYILTTVNITEPNVFGLLAAMAAGEPRLRVAPGEDIAASRRMLREQYLESRRQAVTLVLGRHGHEPAAVQVSFRDRGLRGPSAGLLYALVLSDMLGASDISEGRVIAATGALGDGDRILPVGYVGLKSRVAANAGADVFLVPVGSGTKAGVEVETLADAIRRAEALGAESRPGAKD